MKKKIFFLLVGILFISCTVVIYKNGIDSNDSLGNREYIRKNVSFYSYYEASLKTIKAVAVIENKGNKNIALKAICKAYQEEAEIGEDTFEIRIPQKSVQRIVKIFLKQSIKWYCSFYDLQEFEKELARV